MYRAHRSSKPRGPVMALALRKLSLYPISKVLMISGGRRIEHAKVSSLAMKTVYQKKPCKDVCSILHYN